MNKLFSGRFKFCSVVDKEQLLNLSLMYAATKGFNQRSIIQACNDMQISSCAHTVIKPVELIHFAMKKWNLNTFNSVPKDFNEQKIKNKIKFLIKERLRNQIPYMNRWNEAMATGANPNNAFDTSLILWNFAEDSWYMSGDRSQDYNFYTKRLMFLYVYTSTELNMISDKSLDFEQTWLFLDRRIEDVMSMGSQIEFYKHLVQTLSMSGTYLITMFKNFPKQ